MTNSTKFNRRAFLAAQAGLAALGASGLAQASPTTDWKTITNKELSPMIGDRFTAQCDCGLKLQLKLQDTKGVKSGWHRPFHLQRREGVIGIFASPQAAEFAKDGDRTVKINHAKLGTFDVFLGATPKRSGGYEIELVLN